MRCNILFLGAKYPIEDDNDSKGFMPTQSGLDQVKSDLLVLLLTNPNERVMLPAFGTGLSSLIFEQGTPSLVATAQNMIASAIKTWEPRVAIQSINITIDPDASALNINPTNSVTNPAAAANDEPHVMLIQISFTEFDNITTLEQLSLEIPLAG